MASGSSRPSKPRRPPSQPRTDLLRNELFRLVRTIAEEELLHLELETLAMGRLDRREPVLVDQHHLVTHPLLPRFLRDVLENALAELTRIRRLLEAGGFLLQQHALNHSAHDSILSARLPSSVLIGAGNPTRAGWARSYHNSVASFTRRAPSHRTTSGVMTRSKCVKLCSISGNAALPGRRANWLDANCSAALSLSNSGRHQSPPQMPLGGRCTSSTRDACRATSMTARRWRRSVRRFFGAGSWSCRDSMRATQSAAIGHSAQRGLRAHSVA